MGAALAKDRARDRREGDEVAAKSGSSLGITQRQLGVLASSVMPMASSGHIASARASSAAHAGLRGISNSPLDFDKVMLEEQQADWHGADDLMLSCW